MQQKTHATISALYSSVGRKVLGLILKRNGGDLKIAEQILQDTFIAAYKSFDTFEAKSSYFTWLCKISLNKLADYYRDQVNRNSKTFIPTLDQLNNFIDPSISSEERMSLEELKTRVNKSLDLLPKQYRNLLHLRYYQELSLNEISIKLDMAPRKLEGKLYRAKKSLAKIFTRVNS